MFQLEERLGVFNLKDAKVCAGSTITQAASTCVTTSPQQWAYAALFPLRENSNTPTTTDRFLIIRIDATIEAGCIGAAVAQPNLGEFLCREETAAPGRTTLEVTLRSPEPGSWLVIRNVAAGGASSRVQLHSIKTYLSPDSACFATPAQVSSGLEVFDSPDALAINRARLEHLASMGLDLEGKSVLDLGCGVGHLSGFFVDRGCRVTCVDARRENLERLDALYPGRRTRLANVEVDSLAEIGEFDIVFCYGLLYHCENPIATLRNIASCCREILLLETVITDHPRPILQLVEEPADINNQAVAGFGCRPSPEFIASALNGVGFSFVYTTTTQPNFPDFHFKWKGDCEWSRDGHLLRRVFVASRSPIQNPTLSLVRQIPKMQATAPSLRKFGLTKANPVWLDVGAHLGEKTFSIAAQNSDLRVYAFEPNLTLALQLMGRLPNYAVLPVAVAEKDGSSSFYLNCYDAASSLLPFSPEGLQHWLGGDLLSVESTFTVPTIRLDTFLAQAGIDKVAYLKIDAQGSDLAVIRSLGHRLSDVERISLEVQIAPVPLYQNASRKEEVVDFLTKGGFELASCEKQSHDQEENLTFLRGAVGR